MKKATECEHLVALVVGSVEGDHPAIDLIYSQVVRHLNHQGTGFVESGCELAIYTESSHLRFLPIATDKLSMSQPPLPANPFP